MGQFVPRSFSFPLSGSLDLSPVAAYYTAWPGAVRQGCIAPPPCGGLPFTGGPGCAIPGGRDGGISSRAAPFPMNGKGRGDRVEHHETEVFYEKTPCVYHRRMVRRGLQKHGTGGPVLPSGVRGWVFAHLPYAVSALVPQRRRSRGAQERHRHEP